MIDLTKIASRDGGRTSLLSFTRRDSGHGVDVIDHIERRQCSLITPSPIEPTPTSLDAFYFPIDEGIALETERITLPHTVAVCIRNHMGWMIDELANGDARTLPVDRYSIELSAPIKLYAVVESELKIDVSTADVTLEFGEPTEILVGARSHHKHPAATITTTQDPRDMMDAVSYLGSALKTTTCERSYPTLRGHPPLIELGDELDVPPILDRPDTGVTIELPADYQSVFVAAPLAYYFGAELVHGDEPRIVTESGFVHQLDNPDRGFEREVERVLKQVFFLDCITRTEGYYQVALHERRQIEDTVDLDFEQLYDRPLVEQLQEYLSVPYSLVEPHLPQWKLTAHVALQPEHIETIPFVVNDLAIVRSTAGQTVDSAPLAPAGLDTLTRAGEFARSASTRGVTETVDAPPMVQLEPSDSLEQAWIGEGVSMEASKAMIEAYHNRLDRTPTDGDIDITVVCNDTAMDGERDIVDEVYGSREELPFDVEVHRELTTGELRSVLEGDIDFFHYIGHIDARGFECADGMFDASTLERTGVGAFFLNACSSYEQGLHLIEAGSIAGVVTLQEILNSGAEKIGESLAKLLNQGFPLRAALDIAKTQSIIGGHYLVIGDGNLDITQAESGIPVLVDIIACSNNLVSIVYSTFLTSNRGLGTMTRPYVIGNEEYYLTSGKTGEFDMSKIHLEQFISSEQMPIRRDGKLTWSDNTKLQSLT